VSAFCSVRTDLFEGETLYQLTLDSIDLHHSGTIYVHSVETAVFMAPLSMAPVFLLSGFFAKISKLPWFLKPIAMVSYVRYAFEAFLVAMYGLNRCEDVPLFFDVSGSNASLLAGEDGEIDPQAAAIIASQTPPPFRSR
jgi:hypothetical protein